MHIALYFTTLAGGGTERVLVRLATEFARQGHAVDLVLMQVGAGAYADDIDPRVRIVDLGAARMRTSLPHFIAYLRRERPDVVMSAGDIANAFAGWGARLVRRRPKLIYTNHGSISWILGNDPRSNPLLEWLLKRSYRLADETVAVSEVLAANMTRILKLPAGKKIHVIYNPVWHASIDEKARQELDHPWLHDRDIPVVVAVGRLEKVKDYPTLLRAFAHLRRRRAARLLVLGEGTERAAIEALIRELGLEDIVQLVGFAENPFAWMARASVFVLSSEYEGFGNVIVEAMACGTPVVSTDCPTGPSEILEGGRYGRLVPVGDAEAMAAAIEEQLAHPTPAPVLRERARQFTAEASAETYLKLIQAG